MTNDSRLLRRTLQANGCFSLLSGLLILGFTRPLAGWMGLPDPLWLWALVPGLVLFGSLVLGLGLKREPAAGPVRVVIWLDWGWVLGSAALLSLAGSHFTTAGLLLVADVALIVAVFAILQQIGLRRLACTRQAVHG